MSFRLFSPPTITRIGLGLGLGVSAATLHLSPFRAAPLRCDYGAPQPGASQADWLVKDPLVQKQGRSASIAEQAKAAFLTPENMKEISLGSVLGLVAGVGLRAFSRALVVLLGMGVVLIEVCETEGH